MEYCITRAIIDRKLEMEQFILEKVQDIRTKDVEKKIKFTVHPDQLNEEGFGFS